jgi:HD-like signal output (HDOD) protein
MALSLGFVIQNSPGFGLARDALSLSATSTSLGVQSVISIFALAIDFVQFGNSFLHAFSQ